MINQNEQGRTMLEMLGVIAIIGIITYGAIAGINYGMSSYRINQTYSEIQDIVQGIQDLYSWNKGYPNDSDSIMKAACENDVFARPCNAGNTQVSCPFGDDMRVVPCTDNSPKCGMVGSLYDNFKIEFSVPKEDERQRLLDMDWSSIHVDCSSPDNNKNIVCIPE